MKTRHPEVADREEADNMNLGVTFIDGDFSTAQPHGLPEISYPLAGDSVFSKRDVVRWNPATAQYQAFALGTSANRQPWTANQLAAVLEQEFIVWQSHYVPMRLNTPYNAAWAAGWQTSFNVYLTDFVLVHEGEQRDLGGGLVKFKRIFATVPPTRNEVEQHAYSYIGFDDPVSKVSRAPFQRVVLSRLQFDYYIFDDMNVLNVPLFTAGGHKLDAETGLYPPGLIIPEQKYYTNNNTAVANNEYTQSLQNVTVPNPSSNDATEPSFVAYIGFVNGGAEIVAEASTLSRYMGNIFVLRTRFVLAQ